MTEGFFDTYTAAPAGLSYIGKEEKAAMVADGTSFTIASVHKAPDQFNPGSDRYILVIELDGEERGLGFAGGSVSSRDAMFEALISYLGTPGATPPTVKMVQSGRAVIVTEA